MTTTEKAEALLSPEACRSLKKRFGNKWQKAWVAWQNQHGSWMITKVEWLTAKHDIPENSGDMFCLGLTKPTQATLRALMAHGTRPTPAYTAKELTEALGGGTRH
jgi:hypothetical protein